MKTPGAILRPLYIVVVSQFQRNMSQLSSTREIQPEGMTLCPNYHHEFSQHMETCQGEGAQNQPLDAA